jgi:L-alanine-DL-glutamate epimerase-like enolase superfamily enzyme
MDVFGYTAFKVKVGRGGMWMAHDEGLKRDIDVIHAIRKEFPDSEILIDANDKYSLQDTIDFMEAVKEVGIYWIEEPFIENVKDFYILREYLAKNSPQTLIADGESNWDIDLLIKLAEEKLIDVFLMDIHGYGFTKWRKMMKKIQELGILASPHNWGEKLKTHYSAHMAVAFPNEIKTIEGVPDITEGILFDDYVIKDGKITVPEKGGFGMDIYWAQKL